MSVMSAMLRIAVVVVMVQLLFWTPVVKTMIGAGHVITLLAAALSGSGGDRNGLNPR